MTSPPVGTGLVIWPYDPAEMPLEYSVQILDEMVAHPQFFTRPSTPEERRTWAAAILADTMNTHWGVWKSGDTGPQLVGMLSLTRVQAGLDALVHFLFFDRNLVGRRTLLRRFLGYCLITLGFRRLSAEVPADAITLLKFYRNFGFRFEGEREAAKIYPVVTTVRVPGGPAVQRTATTIALIGSRIEGIYWRDDRWIDVVRLRLFREDLEEGDRHAASRSHSAFVRSRPHRGGVDRQGGGTQELVHHRESSEGPRPAEG